MADSGVCVRCIVKPDDGECCSSHAAPLCHRCYRLTHFVEVCGCQTCIRDGLPKIMGERERQDRRHWHLWAHHAHPLWHGHCEERPTPANPEMDPKLHSCWRPHWHFLFRHRHTESGR